MTQKRIGPEPTPPLDIAGAHRRFRERLLGPQGLRCDLFGMSPCEGEVRLEDSRTMYHWDGQGKDPNALVPLCRSHAEDHHAYWDEMWANYYNSCR